MSEEETGHHWERMSGHDFREDIPPSFEWWRKWVYEPKHEEMEKMITNLTRLLWGLLFVNLSGMASIVAVLLTHR